MICAIYTLFVISEFTIFVYFFSLHRASSSLLEQDTPGDPSMTHVHPTSKKHYPSYLHGSSSSAVKTALPPVNKNKISYNIDISDLVTQEDIPFNTHSKHFEHECGVKKGLSKSHGHKPLPNVRKLSENSTDSFTDSGKHSESALDARLGSVGQGKGGTVSGGKTIAPLKERKTSVERRRSGFLVSVLVLKLSVTCSRRMISHSSTQRMSTAEP